MWDIRSEEEEQLVSDDEQTTAEDLENVLENLGYGCAHVRIALLCAWACSSDAVEIVCISFALPSVECDFAINSFWQGVLTAIIFLGMMVGGYTWGTIADIRGRRAVLITCLLINGLAAVCSSLAQTFWLFLLLRFVSGIGVGGSYPVVFSYFAEWQPRSRRGSAVSFLSTMWMFGGILTAFLAWLIVPHRDLGYVSPEFTFNSWRIFIAICSLPSITSAFFFCCIPESPKYLLQTGRHKEAVLLVNRIAIEYNSPVFVYRLQLGQTAATDGSTERELLRAESALRKLIIKLKVLFSRRFRRIVTSLLIVQVSLAFGYYGLLMWFPSLFSRMEETGGTPCSLFSNLNSTINATRDPCDRTILESTTVFLNSFLVNLSNFPGNVFSIWAIERVGRKPLLVSSMLFTACSIFFISILRTQTHALIMSCLFAAISSVGWNALGVLSTELLPTGIRSTALGLSQALSRVGSIAGNILFGALVETNCVIPMLLAASMLTLGGLFALRFPNMTNKNSY